MVGSNDRPISIHIPLLAFTRAGQTYRALRYTSEASEIMAQVKRHMDDEARIAFQNRLDRYVTSRLYHYPL